MIAIRLVETLTALEHSDPRVRKILQKFPKVLRDELLDALPPERSVTHHINTREAQPVNVNLYPLSDEKIQEQLKQVDLLLKKGLIRLSSSL
jgi:hypothetical protein